MSNPQQPKGKASHKRPELGHLLKAPQHFGSKNSLLLRQHIVGRVNNTKVPDDLGNKLLGLDRNRASPEAM
jgi:hypothetical protein